MGDCKICGFIADSLNPAYCIDHYEALKEIQFEEDPDEVCTCSTSNMPPCAYCTRERECERCGEKLTREEAEEVDRIGEGVDLCSKCASGDEND
jgi:hypothetical protein